MESIRKLSNFNFQWTKTLYQNTFNHVAFFIHFSRALCSKLYEITPKKNVLAITCMCNQMVTSEIIP